MQIQKAFRFELIPDGRQQRLLGRFSGACRYVWNKALAHQKQNYENGGKFLNYAKGMAPLLTAWRNDPETPWLKLAPVHTQQQVLKDLETAFKRFFSGISEHPKFKARHRPQGLRFPDPKQFKLDQANARIFLPKLGWVRFRLSRKVEGDLRNVTVTERDGRWYVSILTQHEAPVPVHERQQSEIALDMGARKNWALLVSPDGPLTPTLNAYRKAEGKLKYLQRCLSRKKKGSKNREKARKRLAKCHKKIANQRADFLHKVSHQITRDYGSITIEDLKVQAMTASKVNPRQKNRAVLDQGWYMLRCLLEYKSMWRGGQLIVVDPAHTSTTCNQCGFNHQDNRRSPDFFKCGQCGHQEQADINAAKNIRARGMKQQLAEGTDRAKAGRNTSRIACGGIASLCASNADPEKQEPTEVSHAKA